MENLKSQLKFTLDIEIKEIIEEATEEAQRIVADAEQEATKIKAQKTKETETLFQEKETSELESANLQKRRRISKARSELINDALNKAKAELERISNENSPRYSESICRMIVEAVSAIHATDLEILANCRDQTLITEMIPEIKKKIPKTKTKLGALKVSKEPLTTIGGIIVQDKDKKQIFNNTFEARLTKANQELRSKLFQDLFEGKDA